MLGKIGSFIHSAFIGLKRFVTNCLIVLALLTPSLTYSHSSESSLAYHQLITRIFPELDTAIFEALVSSDTIRTESEFKQITAWVYRKWHIKVLAIQNSPVPHNARLLAQKLSPEGFDWIINGHLYTPPQQEDCPETEFVIHYFLQIIGTAIKRNKLLQPLQEELIELFQCNNRDCELLAGIEEMEDDSVPASEETKRQLFVDCTLTAASLSRDKRNDFCDAFLLFTSY